MTNTAWQQYGNYERFQVKKSRFGLYTSVTESGECMVTGLTYEIVSKMTELHQICNAPDYDGRHDLSKHDTGKVVDL